MRKFLQKSRIPYSIALCFFFILPAAGTPSFLVEKIEFSGEDSSILTELKKTFPVQIGQKFSSDQSAGLIKTLYKSRYFDDIKIYQQGNTLRVEAHQRPIISEITFSGNSSIKTDQLKQVLQTAGLQKGDMFDSAVLGQVVQGMLGQYYAIGKYAIDVTTEVTVLSGNRISIEIKISEGLTAKIERIDLVGNAVFSSQVLHHQLEISTPNFLTFFTRSDRYSQQSMLDSINSLTKYYMDRGYINFQVDSTQVSLTPDKKHITVGINISEGDRYFFSGYELRGEKIPNQEQLKDLVEITPGEVFSRQKALDAAKRIGEKLGQWSYAFAVVNPVPILDEKNKKVLIVFQVSPNRKYYVRQINFSGNVATNDRVFRQQVRYAEYSPFDSKKIEDSKERIFRYYNFITDVQEKTTPVPDTKDQVDTNFSVKERASTQFGGNIGYSQLYKVMFGLSMNVPNLFGTGNIFEISTQLSKGYKTANVTYTEPYFTLSGVEQTANLYFTKVDNAYTHLMNYSTNSVGGKLDYSIPLNDTDFFTIGGGLDHTQLVNPAWETSSTVNNFIAAHGNSFYTYTLDLGLKRNDTDRAYFPTQGTKSSALLTIAGPGSSLNYYKMMTSTAWFHPITERSSFALGGNFNFGHGYGKDKELAFFQNFIGGGWGSVRGFTPGSLGTLDTLNCTDATRCSPLGLQAGQSLGGNLELTTSANVYFPLPFMMDNRDVRWGLFADAGNLYSTYSVSTACTSAQDGNCPTSYPTRPTFSNLRYSAGIELEWQIPHLGPLAISFAKPLNSKSYDSTNIFQFSIGGYFDH